MNREIKNTSIYLFGAIGAAVLGFINAPLLTRVLEPADYAVYGLITSFVTFASTVSYLGQDEAFTRFYYERTVPFARYLFVCARVPLIVVLMFAVILIEPSHLLAGFVFGSDVGSAFVVGCALYLVLTVIQRFFMLTARMEERAWSYAFAEIAAKLVFTLLALAAWVCFGYLSLAWLTIFLSLGILFSMAVNLPVVGRALGKSENQGGNVQEHERWYLLKFGLPFAVSTSFNFFIPFLERLILRNLLGAEMLGVYTSTAIFATVINLLAVSINNVWLPYAYKNGASDDFKEVFGKVGTGITLLVTLVLALVILTRQGLVLILGSDYRESYIIAPEILYGACLVIVGGIYSTGINLSRKTAYHLLAPVVQCVSLVFLCFGLVPQLGLCGAGLASVISTALGRFARAALGLKEVRPSGGLGKSFCLVLSGVAASVFASFSESLASDAIIAVALLLACFVVCRSDIKTFLRMLEGLVETKRPKGGQ